MLAQIVLIALTLIAVGLKGGRELWRIQGYLSSSLGVI